jgi:hypothetical protein
VESNPKYGPQRRAIIDAADRGGLDGAWVRQLAAWQALRVAHPAGGPIDQGALATWYVERVDELATAGVLELLPRLGKGAWSAGDSEPIGGSPAVWPNRPTRHGRRPPPLLRA